MLSFDTGMDMLSLAVPPLHTAPIFMHRGINNTKATAYEVPHWINLSFVDPERAADALAWVAAAAPRRARDGWRLRVVDAAVHEDGRRVERRHGQRQHVHACVEHIQSRSCLRSLARRVDSLTDTSTASRWRDVAPTPSTRS